MDKQELGQTQYPIKVFGNAEILIFCIHAIWLIAILYYFYYKAVSLTFAYVVWKEQNNEEGWTELFWNHWAQSG